MGRGACEPLKFARMVSAETHRRALVGRGARRMYSYLQSIRRLDPPYGPYGAKRASTLSHCS
jgi:hypothetical protein